MAFDAEKAKSMIEAAGAGSQSVTLMDPADNSTLHPAALIATQSLRRVGFDVQVEAMDWSTLTQRRASKKPPDEGGWNVFITNATATGIANPLTHNFVKNCEQAWYGWPCDPRIVELSRDWASRDRPEDKRHAIARRDPAAAPRERHLHPARAVQARDHLPTRS